MYVSCVPKPRKDMYTLTAPKESINCSVFNSWCLGLEHSYSNLNGNQVFETRAYNSASNLSDITKTHTLQLMHVISVLSYIQHINKLMPFHCPMLAIVSIESKFWNIPSMSNAKAQGTCSYKNINMWINNNYSEHIYQLLIFHLWPFPQSPQKRYWHSDSHVTHVS